MKRIKASNLNRGLVGAWCPSVSGSGLLLPDLSGRGRNGTLTNMDASDWVGTDSGRALDFDATDDRVVVSSLSMAGSFSGSIWCKRRSQGFYQARIFFGNSISPHTYLALITNTTVITQSDDSGTNKTFSGFSFTNNLWFHVVVSRSINNGVRVFVNGLESTSGEQSITGTYTLDQIGAYSTIANALYWWDGQLDDVRIYNRALSPSEIKQLYEGGPGYGLRQERKRSRFQVQGFNSGRFRRQQLIGTGVY